MRLEGKVIIVTGSCTGIGKAIALRCVAEGARVVVHGLEQGLGDEVLAADRAANAALLMSSSLLAAAVLLTLAAVPVTCIAHTQPHPAHTCSHHSNSFKRSRLKTKQGALLLEIQLAQRQLEVQQLCDSNDQLKLRSKVRSCFAVQRVSPC